MDIKLFVALSTSKKINKVISRVSKHILEKLILRANPKNNYECWPSYQRIADDCNITPRAVQNNLKQLISLNFITIPAQSQNKKSKTYRINVNQIMEFIEDSQWNGVPPRNHIPLKKPEYGSSDSGTGRQSLWNAVPPKYKEKYKEKEREEKPTLTLKSFIPSEDHFALGDKRGLSKEKVQEILENFRKYYLGRGGESLNWSFLFEKWIKTEKISESYKSYPEQIVVKNIEKESRLIKQFIEDIREEVPFYELDEFERAVETQDNLKIYSYAKEHLKASKTYRWTEYHNFYDIPKILGLRNEMRLSH